MQRELEIYARAEKQMMINAPGFAPAWELAKHNSTAQLSEEERGNSLPQRLFRKLVGGTTTQALPAERPSSTAPTPPPGPQTLPAAQRSAQ